MQYLIRDLNQHEKPREKLAKLGAANLTDVELIALLLRSGGKGISALDLGRELLNSFQGLAGLAVVDLQQVTQFKFVGFAKAASLIAAIEIGARINREQIEKNVFAKKPEDIVNLLKPDLYKKQKEHLYLISINSRSRVIAKDLLSIGTVSETLLSPREIFKQAFLRNATSIVLAHNHPSNDPTPSTEDIDITLKVCNSAAEVDLLLLDHIIIAENSFMSMKTSGLLDGKKLKPQGGE